MCARCEGNESDVAGIILDFVVLGTDLEVAIRVARDSVTQHALMDLPDEDALQTAREGSELVTSIGGKLKTVRDAAPGLYAAMLATRRLIMAADHPRSTP